MTQAGNSPLGWWLPDDGTHALQPGDVLRARDASDSDVEAAKTADPASYEVVRVVALHRVRETEEAVVSPLYGFGPPVSAPVTGEGGLLSIFDVLTESEAADLLPAAESDAEEVAQTDVAKAVLDRARVGAKR